MWQTISTFCLWLVLAAACRTSQKFEGLDTKPRHDQLRDRLFTTELANGIKVAILPDFRSNLVTVDVRYEVGSADDPVGRSGMAHLAEHVMWETGFQSDDGLRDAALEGNATTTLDRTLFWEIALDVELDRVLDIEARRMENACGDLDPKIVERERDVVIEEVKTRRLWAARDIDAAIWGTKHPYSRPTAGIEILDATAQELCAFVEQHYVAPNATLVVTGKIDGKVLDRIRARFERIPRRLPAARTPVPEVFPAAIESFEVEGLEQPTALMVLPAPPAGSLDEVAGELAARLISVKLSTLPRAWVRQVGDERARAIVLAVEADDVKNLDRVARGLGKLFADSASWGIDRARLQLRDDFALSFDDVYDRGERIASAIARGGFSRYRPLELLEHLERAQVQSWLDVSRARIVKLVPRGTDGHHKLREVVGSLHDVAVRRATAQPTAPLPTRRVERSTEKYTLPNGLHVVLAHDPDSVAVDIRLVLPVGTDSDRDQPGRATLAAWMLKERNAEYEGPHALDLVRWYDERVGTQVVPNVRADATTFSISGLALYGDWLLWSLAWTIVDGKYELPDDLSDRTQPRRAPSVALLIEERLAGKTAREDYSRFTARKLEEFRRSAYRPDAATLIVSGRFDPATMRTHVARRFGDWRETSIPLRPTPPVVRMPTIPSHVAIDDPDTLLVEIGIAFAPSRSDRDLATRAARAMVGEMISDRLRLIRETLGVSYGFNAAHVKGIVVFGSVEPAYAEDAATSIKTELARISAGTELADDFARARKRLLARSLAQPVGAVSRGRELEAAALGNGDLTEALRAIKLDDVVELARGDLRDSRMILVVRGARTATDPVFRALGVEPANVERVQLPKRQ